MLRSLWHRAFRENARLSKTFLVALTGYAMPDDIQRANEAGFELHMAKPPELTELQRVLAQAFSKKATNQDRLTQIHGDIIDDSKVHG